MNKYLLSNINLLMRSDLASNRSKMTQNAKIIVKNEKLLMDKINRLEAKLEAIAKGLGLGFEVRTECSDQAPPEIHYECVRLNKAPILNQNNKETKKQ